MGPDFSKYPDGLVPVIIQDAVTAQVLMLGYVNEEAYHKTLQEGRVTFYSRSKQRLWTKGETSGHFLTLVNHFLDCDQDALLFQVNPDGPTCHTGSVSCFDNQTPHFLYKLEQIVAQRLANQDVESSYTARLAAKGVHKVAQKVGEEGVEVVIEALRDEPELLLNESADLLYHLLVLLRVKGQTLGQVEQVLRNRHQP